ncbi:hypothetical protein R2360_06795 [Mycobacteroides chelonae]|jgi:hypothetical protein|uniref:Uncharacterized protein n=1 Tax=Mycobacteroides chelonae TaxID=1774 RepID=A0AB73U0J4_MYCCH|nr:hypothetical protein [Mycobacteroides chelonae]MEC4839319.1 hypothetical protein [Mycobacteroides chelonae]MEC4844570.1 hypothetical protein [Mycobacteroides chelonae]OLT83826.1 hypothetical protein BKG57_02705 [Mycobacteroides chelonae]QDF70119.1 hypothetical protein FJK96_08150 [Mycobacteroides chelonae]WED93799.1 hypothetical protein PXJ67_10515 [Mycobacteroides chelonae]
MSKTSSNAKEMTMNTLVANAVGKVVIWAGLALAVLAPIIAALWMMAAPSVVAEGSSQSAHHHHAVTQTGDASHQSVINGGGAKLNNQW